MTPHLAVANTADGNLGMGLGRRYPVVGAVVGIGLPCQVCLGQENQEEALAEFLSALPTWTSDLLLFLWDVRNLIL